MGCVQLEASSRALGGRPHDHDHRHQKDPESLSVPFQVLKQATHSLCPGPGFGEKNEWNRKRTEQRSHRYPERDIRLPPFSDDIADHDANDQEYGDNVSIVHDDSIPDLSQKGHPIHT